MPPTKPTQRQQLLLEMLRLAGGRASRLALMKWLFLLVHETDWGRRETPYEFVPYQSGPFSFVVYDDLRALCDKGILRQADDGVAFAARARIAVPPASRRAIDTILTKYSSLSLDDLLRRVYAKYPWYATLTERHDLAPETVPRQTAPPKVYTIGYAGRSVDGFLDLVLKRGLEGVIDVRSVPFSRAFGFSGRKLQGYLNSVGLVYLAHPELGIPSDQRNGVQTPEGRRRLLEDYAARIETEGGQALDGLCREVASTPLALMCMEAEARDCHRGVLAGLVADLTGLPVEHM